MIGYEKSTLERQSLSEVKMQDDIPSLILVWLVDLPKNWCFIIIIFKYLIFFYLIWLFLSVKFKKSEVYLDTIQRTIKCKKAT